MWDDDEMEKCYEVDETSLLEITTCNVITQISLTLLSKWTGEEDDKEEETKAKE